MGEAGRRRAVESFGWDAVARETVELYRSLRLSESAVSFPRSRDVQPRVDLPLSGCYLRLSADTGSRGDQRPASASTIRVGKGRERVRVAVVGGASGVRRSIVDLLVAEGHDVVTAPRGSQRPPLEGCRALVHVPDQLPHTLGSSWSQRWPAHDQLHAHGVRRLVDQACAAGVRRIVHLSGSWLYADQGDDWVTERSPVCVNCRHRAARGRGDGGPGLRRLRAHQRRAAAGPGRG